MPKRKWNLNDVYISERLQECLRPISHCSLTTVVAPMGYGKTTAISWFLNRHTKSDGADCIRISVYSDNLAIFWRSVQCAFANAGFGFLMDFECPEDAAGASMLADELCHELVSASPCFIFIDDFHLLTDGRASGFICTLANRLPDNVHMIVASRDRFLPGEEIVRLGGKVYQIGTEHLRLNHTELSVYAHRLGTELSEEQIDRLIYTSEGWFSAIYLNLLMLSERGRLPDGGSDIYEMFSAAVIDPLPANRIEFLAVMGLADEITVEMAEFVTGNCESENLLNLLTEQNAFVKRLPDGKTFRFHHMMKECAERRFLTFDMDKQIRYRNRLGEWYENHEQYIHALVSYRAAENYDAALYVIQKDTGVLLASLRAEDVMSFLEDCSAAALKDRPLAVLVLMRCMFNWRQIPEMMRLKELLLASVSERPDMSETERGNLLGECDLIMSFLKYNDISEMSRLHRSASRQMSRPAVSIRNSGGWTFGSPSVLMMFHREPGGLEKELAEMYECMPHYYRITNGHGQGAERIMNAEAAYIQGRFADALIELEGAYSHIEDNGQENMRLCCDFLMCRLSLFIKTEHHYTLEERRSRLLCQHNTAWINIFNSICAYYYALVGAVAEIPEVFRNHMMTTVNILAPGKPMMGMIENQVYLVQEAYAKVIGRSEKLLELCGGLCYGLVSLYVKIQMAAAYEGLGKRPQAKKLLEAALTDAVPDRLILPFVENYLYISEVLKDCTAPESAVLTGEIEALGTDYVEKCRLLSQRAGFPRELDALTEREREITRLIAGRLSNREIADKLFLSEGSVKQYVNQIYSKLNMAGDTRTKRRQLIYLFENRI